MDTLIYIIKSKESNNTFFFQEKHRQTMSN